MDSNYKNIHNCLSAILWIEELVVYAKLLHLWSGGDDLADTDEPSFLLPDTLVGSSKLGVQAQSSIVVNLQNSV